MISPRAHMRYFLCLLSLCGLIVSSAARAETPTPLGLTPLTLQLKWKHQFQFAGYYMAQEKGYYADANMVLRFKEAVAGEDPMKEVVAGRADFGVGTTDLLQMHDQGIGVVVLATIFQHSPVAIMVKKETDILSAHNLAHKKLMMEPNSAELLSYLSSEGVNPDELKTVDHTFDIKSLLQGTVDGMSVYLTDEPFLMKAAGTDYRLLRPIDSGIDFYGDNLFTMGSTIDAHPETVKNFLAATRKGWVYALNNIDETVDLIRREYSDRKSREHLLFEAARTKSLILPDVVEVGYMNPYRWERIAQSYIAQGLLKDDFAIDGLLYNPEEALIPAWLWQLIIAVSAIALAAFFTTAWVVRVNRRLRTQEVRLLEANQYKETLLSIVGHDVKNSIFSVRRYGEMLVSNDGAMDDTTTTNFGQRVLYGVDAAIDILDNLLQWAMLQQADMRTSDSAVNLTPIIHKNVDIISPHAESSGISVSTDVPDHISAQCNSWRIDTVIRNLLNNALKFTTRGDSISIRATADTETVRIFVEDTGKGMPEADIALAFSHDIKSGKDSTGAVGTGFGLPLCKRLLQSNGGDIALRNRSEGGLQATITLPIATPG